MYPTHNESFRIKSYEVDFADKLKLSSLFLFFQESAYNHAESYGLGYNGLKEKGLFWVLSRIKVNLFAYPLERDLIRIETWPKGVSRLAAFRDFQVTDEAGRLLIAVTSQWLVLDVATKRPRRVEFLPQLLPIYEGKEAIVDELEKLHSPGELEHCHDKRAAASDVDINRHVNNAKYIDWITDCFSLEELERRPIRSLQVNYLAEVGYGEEVAIRRGRETDGRTYIEGMKQGAGAVAFNALIEF